MKIDHIGYAVKYIEKAVRVFEKLGYNFGEIIDDTDRNVKISFGKNDGYRIELISPLDKDKTSPVDLYLRNSNGMPYHICYTSEAIDRDIAELTKAGFKVVLAPSAAVAFGGKRVVFMMSIDIGLMEIVEV